MASKLVVFLCAVAYAKAGLLGAPAAVVSYGTPQLPAVTSQHQNILRTPGNLGQISTYSKTIDTPFSSVSKHDVRVSNPGYVSAAYAAPVAAYAAPVAAVAAPVVAKTYAAPVVARTYAAPATYAPGPTVHAAYASPAVAAYHAPIVAKTAYAAPAVAAYAAPVVAKAAYATPIAHAAYAAPVAHAAYAAPAAAHGLIGVAYSAAPAVAHVEYHGNLIDYAF